MTTQLIMKENYHGKQWICYFLMSSNEDTMPSQTMGESKQLLELTEEQPDDIAWPLGMSLSLFLTLKSMNKR